MVFDPNVNDEAPTEIKVERRIKNVHCGPDSALIKTDAKEKTPSGILLPMSVQQSVNTGTVINIGEGGHDFAGHHIPPVAKVGDTILFGQLSRCFKFKMDLGDGPQDYHLIDQDEILMVTEYEDDDEATEAPVIADVGVGVAPEIAAV